MNFWTIYILCIIPSYIGFRKILFSISNEHRDIVTRGQLVGIGLFSIVPIIQYIGIVPFTLSLLMAFIDWIDNLGKKIGKKKLFIKLNNWFKEEIKE